MKNVVKGKNDLLTIFPDLCDDWDYDKNELSPSDVLSGSSKKYWWKCKKGHSWQTTIHNRKMLNSGCPYCSNHKVLTGYNDLATLYPALAIEFDVEKNGVLPNNVLAGGEKKYWWICPNGHSYETNMNRRTTRGNGCPYCSSHRVLEGFNDLETTHSTIATEWDYSKNGGRTPNEFSKGSSYNAWWVCPNGHSYQNTINSRCSGGGCPYCSNTKLLKGFNDLETTNPQLAKEWHPTKNGDIRPCDVFEGTVSKYWWLCEHGHEWQQSPHLRSKGRGCPICSNEIHVSFPEKVFYYYISKKIDEVQQNYNPKWNNQRNIDIYIPKYKIGIEYDGKRWHQNSESDLLKNKLCREYDITLIRIREEGCPELKDSSFDFSFSNDYQAAFDFITKIMEKVTGIKYEFDIDLDKDRTVINELVLSSEKQDNICVTNPEILKEWDYIKNGFLKPEFLTKGSTKKVWWVCSKGHSWLASVSNRCRLGRGCPYCFGNKVLDETQSIAKSNPDLLSFWDYEKNDIKPSEVMPGSGKKVWWRCEKNHSFQKPIRDMVEKKQCPICNNTILITGKNDFATLYQNLLIEWDYNKNTVLPTKVKPGSSIKAWWICDKGHSYQSKIQSRVAGHNCPICYGKKIVTGFNDLNTLYPDIAAEFDEEKNYPLKKNEIGSKVITKVWWKCSKCGYEWEARINWRTSGHGCPNCRAK